ncbi:TPA: TetR family transcriptional regulator [Pseudomonas aeruginosa]|uniref:TetR family transcriptional regulator n=1 Tax=Pseudomonas aeruginosa TaxID=287 RepID=UPI002159DDCA|nr:TetR family transcriptional regulator [Pseudomonas aeruginosa]
MSDMNETKDRVADAPGKRALLEAALRLGSSSRSLGAIGLRELAREAGLNPNTFYRHFRDIDDLGLTMIRDISTQLRQPLRQLRREAATRAAPGARAQTTPFGLDLERGAAGLPGDGAAVLRLRGEQSRRVHRRRARTAWGFAGAAWCPASDHG